MPPSSSSPATFNPAAAAELRELFEEFISHIKIDSKDAGAVRLEPFRAQQMFLDSVFDGLEGDIHWHVVLKARQLGMTTISLALDLFWLGMFPALQGALITDTGDNLKNARDLIIRMLASLPPKFAIPVYSHNSSKLMLANGSGLAYMRAGTGKNSGLGRSRGLNFLHATECGAWGDEAGLESLIKALSDEFPARLYIFESTAQGYNLFYDMWRRAKQDTLVQKATFIGWWAKNSYRFDPKKQSKLYLKYSAAPINEEEQELIDTVKEEYGWDVSLDQLAWYRHKKNPASDDRTEDDIDDASIIEQELPWHEKQAFMLTGNSFFNMTKIDEVYLEAKGQPFKGFRYHTGSDFLATVVEQVKTARDSMLKVWEDPMPGARYVAGADPAYGSSDEADAFVIQVCRCYSDRLEQVAEFRAIEVQSYQFAWILSHVCGFYNNARLLLELSGPGEAVFVEMRHLQQLIMQGALRDEAEDNNIRNVFGTVRNYIFSRIDNLQGGASAYHWKTNVQNKVSILTQMKDHFNLGQLQVRSIDLLGEMGKVVQSGLEIRGEGKNKDDRVMAMAFAVRAWIDSERRFMISTGRSKEIESRKDEGLAAGDMHRVFMQGLIKGTMEANASRRHAAAAAPPRWRGPPRRSNRW